MEYTEFDSSNYKLYNPVIGDTIVDEWCNDDSESLIAYWIDEVFSEPIMNNPVFRKAWEDFSEKYCEENEDDDPDYEVLGEFLRDYENPQWKVYEITSCGMACGPVSTTVWMVVDKDTIIEDVEDEEDVEGEEHSIST
jgi:hypothetical protein